MPFRFSYLGDLLQELEDYCMHDPPLLPLELKSRYHKAVRVWFQCHRTRIDALDASGVAFLSACFPERRTDRVYNLREKKLVPILGRILALSKDRQKSLEAWCLSGGGDLGACVERVQRQAEMPVPLAGNEVTIEEIDAVVAALAAGCRFSSPAVRKRTVAQLPRDSEALLRPVYHRLRSRDAKWLTRMLLKNYAPVIVPEYIVLNDYHFLLPDLLKIQNTFDASITLLREAVPNGSPVHPSNGRERETLRQAVMQRVRPKVGVKIGRTAFFKARSIKHCLEMVGNQRMSLERKYDGEYCQIHVDLAGKDRWLQIFSKSGKDSTADRAGLHETIRKCLRVDQSGSRFSRRCILEGEMVVFSDKDNRILEFHKIRKHVSRSGSYLGTENDSQAHDHEHLMIILYDILLLDDNPVLTRAYCERKRILEDLVLEIPGRAELAMRKSINFGSHDATESLRLAFAHGIAMRWEGFVLKPVDRPYFHLGQHRTSHTGHWIKLKKDYISGLGDTADFAIIGAGFDGRGLAPEHTDLKWTHFHVGCLKNKEEVIRFAAKPQWRVIQSVNQCINKADMKTLNHVGQFRFVDVEGQTSFEGLSMSLDLGQEDCKMQVVFREPFVFEVVGGGFVKPPGKSFYSLRWPRVSKIHWDRSWMDSVSFEELQQMASKAITVPESGASQEEIRWIERLEGAGMGVDRVEAMMADSSWQRGKMAHDEGGHGDCLEQASPCSIVAADHKEVTCGQESKAIPSLPTPPSSSEVHVSQDRSVAAHTAKKPSPRGSKKRKADDVGYDMSTQAQRGKRNKGHLQDSSACSFTSTTGSPLADITHSPQAQRARPCLARASSSSPPPPPPPSSSPAKSEVARKGGMAGRSTTKTSSQQEEYSASPSRCTLPDKARHDNDDDNDGRLLSNTIVLLSPCVSQMPYITEDMLSAHGIPYIIDPNDFLLVQTSHHHHHHQNSSAAENPKKSNKIALVESHRPTATAQVIRDLTRLRLPRLEVAVYDWRLLEDLIDRMEGGGNVSGSNSDVWKRHFICAV